MVKKHVTIRVEKDTLKQWDEFAKSIGTNRTAMIHNAVKIYQLFIKNELNQDHEDNIKEQLDHIESLIQGLKIKQDLLIKEKEVINESISSINIDDIKDFNIISNKILDLLKNWGSLPESTISVHLQYPGWIIWTVLKKLKAMKKVKVENGEWCLYSD